jgi:hypothetical protein
MTFFSSFFLLRRWRPSTGSACLHATIVLTFSLGGRTLWKHITTSIPLLACWTHKGIEEFVFLFTDFSA